MKRMQYYKFDEADMLKQVFSSWIGKFAHIGSGKIEVLERILVKPKRKRSMQDHLEPSYLVQFEFKNDLRLNADEFLAKNGLNKPSLITTEQNLHVLSKK